MVQRTPYPRRGISYPERKVMVLGMRLDIVVCFGVCYESAVTTFCNLGTHPALSWKRKFPTSGAGMRSDACIVHSA